MKAAEPTLVKFATRTVAERKTLPMTVYGELIAEFMKLAELLRSNPGLVALMTHADHGPRAS